MQWYELMLRIRRFEERALMGYSQQKIRGFLHVYIGQEAVSAGLESAIRPEDCIVTAYRQHGIALGRGVSSRACDNGSCSACANRSAATNSARAESSAMTSTSEGPAGRSSAAPCGSSATTCLAAVAMAIRPDEHWRSIV